MNIYSLGGESGWILEFHLYTTYDIMCKNRFDSIDIFLFDNVCNFYYTFKKWKAIKTVNNDYFSESKVLIINIRLFWVKTMSIFMKTVTNNTNKLLNKLLNDNKHYCRKFTIFIYRQTKRAAKLGI